MLIQILKREIRDHLMSLRLILTFSLILILMAANAFMFNAEYKRQLSDFNVETNRSLADLARSASSSMPLFNVFSYGRQRIQKSPNPAAFLAEGHDREVPNSFSVNAFKIAGPSHTLRSNPMLGTFDSLDWAFIISVVLGFAAIILVYDSVNGEKEGGTLRLLMSNPVPREKVLLGKYLGALIVLTAASVAGTLLNLVILSAGGTIQLNVDLAIRVAAALTLTILYLSFFVLLGLFLSTRMRHTVSSLVTGLLIWVTAVIVIPAAGNLLARALVKLPPEDRVLEDAKKASDEAIKNYNRRRPHPDNWIMSGNWSPGEPLLRALEVGRAYEHVVRAYQDLQVSQVLLGKKIARTSPAALFTEAMEELAESGVFQYRRFLESAHRYREQLGEFLVGNFPFDPASPLDRNATDRVLMQMKLDFGSIPKYEDRQAPAVQTAGQVVGKAGILALINVLLFAGAYVSFLRYDVR